MNFLPKDYEAPAESGGRYLSRFPSGETRIRVLSEAVTGWLYWNTNDKPVRLKKFPETYPDDAKPNKDGSDQRIKHFWAFTCWDYQDKTIKICEITQSTIRSAITAFIEDNDYGDPTGYDLKINRTGEALDTKYHVVPGPKGKVSAEIEKIFEDTPVDLEALFDGTDPFEG